MTISVQSGNTISDAPDPTADPAAIHVVVGCDDAYARHLSVLLLSLFAHATSRAVRVHVLVPPRFASRPKLDQALGRHAPALTWHSLDEASCPDPAFAGFLASATYFRCFMGFVLPRSIQRVIYLDCDMIVRRDLTDLWRMPLGDKVLAAVPDAVPDRRDVLGLPADAPYFNAGMLLVDLARWRDEAIGEAALHFASRHPGRLSFADQCALNWTLRDRWLELEPRWNAMYDHFSNGLEKGMGYPRPVPPIVADPGIVHFNAPGRPWLYMDSHPFKPEYLAYEAKTPWRDSRPADRRPATVILKALGRYGLVLRRAYWRMAK